MKYPALLASLATLLIMAACSSGGATSTPVIQATFTPAEPTATPRSTPNIDATVEARLQTAIVSRPTATPLPAPTIAATSTPKPTSIPTPIPASTTLPPSPTPPPPPTSTLAPAPTATPLPPPTPVPTATPAPTPTPELSVTLSLETSGRASKVAITGRGFTPTGIATIKYAGSIVTASKTDVNGVLAAIFTVPLSAAFNSPHVVEAIDDATGRTVSVDHFVPPPSLSLEPLQGFPGTPFDMIGQGYPPLATVRPILFFGADVSAYPYTAVDSTGAFVIELIAPSLSSRDYTVSATAEDGVAEASFKILPAKLGLEPSAGPPNTTVIVNGWGFPASSELASLDMGGVDILAGAESQRANLGLTTTVWGEFEVEVTVPEISSGAAEVVAEVAGVSANSMLTVPLVVIDLTPAEGPMFGPVTIRGSGFPAFTLVTSINIRDVPLLGSHRLETDADGAFSLGAVVPAFSPGPVQVSTTVGNISFTTDFVVTP